MCDMKQIILLNTIESVDVHFVGLPLSETTMNSEFHSTVILSEVDMNTLKKLGIHVTCEPQYQTKKLYHG